MNDIRSLLKVAGARLELMTFLGSLHGVAIVVAAVALVLALADRVPAEAFVAWIWVGPTLAAVGLAVAAVLWSRRRRSELQVALAVDDRLDLREKLSTALHCERRDDAFAQAAVEDAVRTAQDPRTRETVRRRFSVEPPRQWWISPLVIMLAVVVLLLPQANLFADEEPEIALEQVEAQKQSDQVLEAIVKAVEDKDELNKELADLVGELTKDSKPADALQKPEDVKRNALKKVTELNRRLDDILNGEKGKTSEAMENMLSKLKTPDSGPAKDLAEALAAGNFADAKKALDKMLEDAKNGNLNEDQKKQLAEQLEKLADQMDQLAKQQQQLEQALQQAGLDPQLANNPQLAEQAIQNAQNLNQQQKQQLQQMLNAQQQAQQMCEGLGGACRNMAQAMGQNGQFGEAGQQMAGQLNQLEQMQQLLQQAQAMAGQCQGQCEGLGQGLNMVQALQQWKQGGGMGQWGQGAGGKAPLSPTPVGTKMTKADAPVVDGEIIASMLMDGTPITGESKAKLKAVAAAAAKGYDESVNEDTIPLKYREVLQHYFGELKERTRAKTATLPEGEAEAEKTGEPEADEPANESESGN